MIDGASLTFAPLLPWPLLAVLAAVVPEVVPHETELPVLAQVPPEAVLLRHL